MLEQKVRRWEQEFIEKGMLIGEEKGFVSGQAAGLASGLATGLANQKNTLLEMLGDRFGAVPMSWQEKIADLDTPDIVSQLTRAVWKVKSADEFGLLLSVNGK